MRSFLLLVSSAIVYATPNTTHFTQYPVEDLEFQLEFLERVYFREEDITEFRYQITVLPGFSDLHQWVLGVPDCGGEYTAEPESSDVAPDPYCTGLTGLTWDEHQNQGTTQFYTVFVTGSRDTEMIPYAVKAADYFGKGMIEGPSCAILPVYDDCPPYESDTTFCNATVHNADAECHCLCNCVNECFVGNPNRVCDNGEWVNTEDCFVRQEDQPCLDIPQNMTIPANVECILVPLSLNQPFDADFLMVDIQNPRPDQVTFSQCTLFFIKDSWYETQYLEVCFSERGGSFWNENFPIDLQCTGEPAQNIYMMRQPAAGAYALSYADPHLYTYDGLEYDNFYAGDFWFTRHIDGLFSVTTRQRKCFADWNFDGGCNYAVAVQYKSSVVYFSYDDVPNTPDAPDSGAALEMWHNGADTLEADGVNVLFNGPRDTYWVTINNMPDLEVEVDLQAIIAENFISTRYLDVLVIIPEVYRDHMWGQAGNFDGTSDAGDNVDRDGNEMDGTYLPSPEGHSDRLREDLHFLVEDDENLFLNPTRVPLVEPLQNLGGVTASSGSLSTCDAGASEWRPYLVNSALNLPYEVYNEAVGKEGHYANDGVTVYGDAPIFASLLGDKTKTAYWRIQFPELKRVHYIRFYNTLDYQKQGIGSFPRLLNGDMKVIWTNQDDRIRFESAHWHYFPEVPVSNVTFGEWRQFFKFASRNIQIMEIEFYCENDGDLRMKRTAGGVGTPLSGHVTDVETEDPLNERTTVTGYIPEVQPGTFKRNVPEPTGRSAKRATSADVIYYTPAQKCNNVFGQYNTYVGYVNSLENGQSITDEALALCLTDLCSVGSHWNNYIAKVELSIATGQLDEGDGSQVILNNCVDACNGVGSCSGTTCTCFEGYTGPTCNAVIPPTFLAWEKSVRDSNAVITVTYTGNTALQCEFFDTTYSLIDSVPADPLFANDRLECVSDTLEQGGFYYLHLTFYNATSLQDEILTEINFHNPSGGAVACATSNPCLNGGVCNANESPEGFECVCSEDSDFSGTFCGNVLTFGFSTEEDTVMYAVVGILAGMLAIAVGALIFLGVANRRMTNKLISSPNDASSRMTGSSANKFHQFEYEEP